MKLSESPAGFPRVTNALLDDQFLSIDWSSDGGESSLNTLAGVL